MHVRKFGNFLSDSSEHKHVSKLWYLRGKEIDTETFIRAILCIWDPAALDAGLFEYR